MDDLANIEFRNLIGEIVDRTGLSPTEIARRAGVHPSTLTRQYPEPTAGYGLSARTMARIKRAFPPPQESYAQPVAASPRVREAASSYSVGMVSSDLALYQLLPADPEQAIPGADLGELELFLGNLDQPVGRVQMPWTAEEGRYFATFMPGDSMVPRFRPGEKLLIDRIRPAPIGAEVLVSLASKDMPALFCIARLVDRDRNMLSLRQYGYDSTARLHRSFVKALYLIVGLFEDG